MDSSEKEDPKKSAGAFRAVIHLYVEMTLGSRFLFACALALLAVSLLMYLAFAIAVGKLVDGAIGNHLELDSTEGWMATWGINQWALFLFALVLVNMISSFFETCWFQLIGERAAVELRTQLFDRLMYLPMGFFSMNRAGDLASRVLADVGLLQEGWINDVRNGLSYIAMGLGSVTMLFVISPSLAVFVFLIGFPVIAVSIWFGRKIGADSKRVQDKLGQTSVISEEAIHGIHRVKTFTNEDYENRKFRAALSEYLSLAKRVAINRAGLFSGILFILMSSSVFLMWYGSLQVQQGKLSPGDFTSFMFFLGFLGNAGGLLAQLTGRVHRMTGAAQRVCDLLNEKPEKFTGENTPTERMTGDIEFCDVSFSYPGRAQLSVLNNINLHLKAGECVAIVGPSGAGKSTLTALMFRLFEPSQGILKIDGRNAEEHSLKWLRQQMAMVPQETLLFGGTLEENISYGRPGASRKEIIKAARQANAMEFIERLPDNLDTPAGDRGTQFSGGQRQRIAIARAILRDPAVLVLDEATSSLDTENERLVRDALEGLIQKRTTLVIAHRLSTVRRADKIIVMKEGRIVEQGSHDELYAANGFYRHLCDEQQCLTEDQ
ncbi:MAG: ABC transporter ATP-binding protein [Verrucomicrobia bacterium]|nr:ABC transporter ATP-binding protein [Verrucomicrobiota bacterium]